jgi:hypothetical protein
MPDTSNPGELSRNGREKDTRQPNPGYVNGLRMEWWFFRRSALHDTEAFVYQSVSCPYTEPTETFPLATMEGETTIEVRAVRAHKILATEGHWNRERY